MAKEPQIDVWGPAELTATGAIERDENNPARRRWTGRVGQQHIPKSGGGFVPWRKFGNIIESAAGELDFDSGTPSLFRRDGKALVGAAEWLLFDRGKSMSAIPLKALGVLSYTGVGETMTVTQRWESIPPKAGATLDVDWQVMPTTAIKQTLRLASVDGGAYRLVLRMTGVPNKFVMEKPVDAGGLRTILMLDDLRISLSPAETALLAPDDVPRLIADKHCQIAFDVTVPAGGIVEIDPTFSQQITAVNHNARYTHGPTPAWGTTIWFWCGMETFSPYPYATSYGLWDTPDLTGVQVVSSLMTLIAIQSNSATFAVNPTVRSLAQSCPELTTDRHADAVTAGVDTWVPPAWTGEGTYTVVATNATQSWIDGGYSSGGGGLALAMGNVPAGLTAGQQRVAYSYNGSAAKAPRLTIDYTTFQPAWAIASMESQS